MTLRLGAIDVGTNTVLLTIATSDGQKLVPLVERATITRLGQGVDQSGELHPDARARTLACLENYRALCDAHGVTRLLAVGTSALRDARDGGAFREKAREILGVALEIIPGEREAALTFRGGISGIDWAAVTPHAVAATSPLDAPDAPTAPDDHDAPAATGAPTAPDDHAAHPLFVFDIGGGSTELIWGSVASGPGGAHHATWTRATSLNLGSVRLFERFRMTDPPGAHELEALAAFIDAELTRIDPPPTPLDGAPLVIGIAGTVTTLVALVLGSKSEFFSGPGPAHAARPKEPLPRSISPTRDAAAPTLDARDSAPLLVDTSARDRAANVDDDNARDISPTRDDTNARDSAPLLVDEIARDAPFSVDVALTAPSRESNSTSPDASLAADLVSATPAAAAARHTTFIDAPSAPDALISSTSVARGSSTPPSDTSAARVALSSSSVHGLSATLAELRALSARLARLSTTERCQLPGLDPGRADVIVIGAILCVRLLEWMGADSVVASDRGVRWGLLEEAQESIDSRQTSD